MTRAGFIVAVSLLALVGLALQANADTGTAMGDRNGEGSTQFTGLAETPEANLYTGAVSTTIPIMVPPGRKNVTPALALQYSSTGGPSPYGFGWDLPIGRIQRSTKFGVPRCTGAHANDFVLTLPSGTAELVEDPPGSALYRPAIEESYIQAQKNADNSWTVYDRAGMKYVFGDVVSARVDASGPCSFTTIWALTHVEDPNGNSIDIIYVSVSNVLYPVYVKYGGNAQTQLGHVYVVKFTYELRPDVIENDLSGAAAVLTMRLALIRVTTTVPSYTEFRTYTLSYDNGQDGYGSILSSVALTGYPTQALHYSDGVTGHAATQTFPAPAGLWYLRKDVNSVLSETLMDINGDGLLDIVISAGQSNWWSVYFAQKNPNPPTPGSPMPAITYPSTPS